MSNMKNCGRYVFYIDFVMKLVEDAKGFDVVDVYVEHVVDKPALTNNPIIEKELDAENLGAVGGKTDKGVGVEAEVGVENRENSSEDDSEYVASEGDEDEYDNWVADSDFDDEKEWTTVLPEETFVTTNAENSSFAAIFDDESCDSDVLLTPPGSDEEDIMEKFPTFKDNTELKLSMMFNNKGQKQKKEQTKKNQEGAEVNTQVKVNPKKKQKKTVESQIVIDHGSQAPPQDSQAYCFD